MSPYVHASRTLNKCIILLRFADVSYRIDLVSLIAHCHTPSTCGVGISCRHASDGNSVKGKEGKVMQCTATYLKRILFALALSSASLFAQTVSSSLEGVVVDPADAAV